MKIKVFLSKSNHPKSNYKNPINLFKNYLNKKGLETITLGDNLGTIKLPLEAIKNEMKECFGAIILGTPQIEKKDGSYMSTPWNQIEGALAYDNDLPILIISTESPIIDEGLFKESTIPTFYSQVNLKSSKWFISEPFVSTLDKWIDAVKKNYYKKQP